MDEKKQFESHHDRSLKFLFIGHTGNLGRKQIGFHAPKQNNSCKYFKPVF